MALSPVVTQNAVEDAKITAPKVKALAVRSGSISKVSTDARPSSQNKVSELAEQLNEETKQKYVKGESGYTIPYL